MKKIKEEMTLNEFARDIACCRDDYLIIKQLINLYPTKFKDGPATVLKKKQLEDILYHYMRDRSKGKALLKLTRKAEKTKDKIGGRRSGVIIDPVGSKLEKDLPAIEMEDS